MNCLACTALTLCDNGKPVNCSYCMLRGKIIHLLEMHRSIGQGPEKDDFFSLLCSDEFQLVRLGNVPCMNRCGLCMGNTCTATHTNSCAHIDSHMLPCCEAWKLFTVSEDTKFAKVNCKGGVGIKPNQTLISTTPS